jgi:zinc protease
VANNLKDSYPQDYAKNLKGAKLADIHQAAKTIIKPGQLTWVVVGDKDKVMENIKSLGYEVKIIDADGLAVKE